MINNFKINLPIIKFFLKKTVGLFYFEITSWVFMFLIMKVQFRVSEKRIKNFLTHTYIYIIYIKLNKPVVLS